MKVKLSINFELFRKSLNGFDQHVMFQSFYDFCIGTVFSYQSVPRIGELIDIEDIIQEWSEKYHKETANKEFNKLWRLIRSKVRVYDVTHSLQHIIISCNDVDQSE